jgi:hypothetical protein
LAVAKIKRKADAGREYSEERWQDKGLPGSSFKPVALPLEHKAVFVTLSICNHDILQFSHYCLGTLGHQVKSSAVIRFCKIVLLSKPSQRKDKREKAQMKDSLSLTPQATKAVQRERYSISATSYNVTCFLKTRFHCCAQQRDRDIICKLQVPSLQYGRIMDLPH